MNDPMFQMLIPMVGILGIFYFIVWRPQQAQAKKLREAVEGMRRGDTVVLNSGIIGKIAKVPQKDEPEVSVEISDNVTIRVLRAAVAEVRAKNQPVDVKAEK
ncbi:MAG: preprotein translocase subunit YajC [Rhizomicrobium sp.]|nr:preprotein translocase subunit YajC [Rhizomicrobium sp.]